MTRAPELRSNDSLPAAFERAAGERIYDGLRNGFRVRCICACHIRVVNALAIAVNPRL